MATLGLSLPRVQCTSTSVPREEACLLPPTSPFLARYVDHLSKVQTLARPILSASRTESKVVSWFPPKDTYCNLGWALVAADLNGDREPDLVIGSPFAPGGGKQKGIVAAFYSDPGHSNKGNTCWGKAGAFLALVGGTSRIQVLFSSFHMLSPKFSDSLLFLQCSGK